MSNTLPGTFFLAPMAELTTPALRQVVKGFSPGVVLCSEMLSAGAVAADNGFNRHMQHRYHFDEPYVYQLMGSDADTMGTACARLSRTGCRAIDINMGCSAPDIVKTGSGAALLKEIDHTRNVVRQCRSNTTCLLSVKMRSGYHSSDLEYIISFARMLEEEGVDYITMHPRHAKLSFKRKADWAVTRELANTLHIPVIGNGDIVSAEQAVQHLHNSSCNAVMIGRTAVSMPWIFHSCEKILSGDRSSTIINIHQVWNRVLSDIRSFLPVHLHKSRGHRFSFYYSKNVTFAHQLFTHIRNVDNIPGMMEIIDDYFQRNPREAWKVI